MIVTLYQNCIDFLMEKGAHRLKHSDRSFLHHCVGVAKLLDSLNCDKETIIAGLLHNSYGNEYYDPNLNISRDDIKNIVGNDIENLVYLFVNTKRDEIVKQKNLRLLMIYLINDYEQTNAEDNIKSRVFDIIRMIKNKCEVNYDINFINKSIELIKKEYNNK